MRHIYMNKYVTCLRVCHDPLKILKNSNHIRLPTNFMSVCITVITYKRQKNVENITIP